MTLETSAKKITETPGQDSPDATQLAAAQRDLLARLASASVADAMGLLVRSDRYRYYALADLEWLLLPPLALGQVMFAYQRPMLAAVNSTAQGSAKGEALPTLTARPLATAMLTWALVSPDVGAKISAQKEAGAPVRLAPQEWRSGNEVHVVEAIGPAKEIAMLTVKLQEQFLADEAGNGAAA
jgi:hemolysin-activating ACP:hemolysin acyltransferase